MPCYRFKLKDGDLCERFALNLERDDDCYKALLAKLAEYGHSANGKKLVHMEYDGSYSVISDCKTLWDIIEDSRYNNGFGSVILLEYCKPIWQTPDNGSIYFRFKDGELCRRFSLKLDRNKNAYKMLLNKLEQFRYKASGRLLVCTENDGSRTIIEDCDSLWTVIETNCAGGPTVTLQLEYFNAENSDNLQSVSEEQNSNTEPNLTEDKLSKLEQNVEKLANIIGQLANKM